MERIGLLRDKWRLEDLVWWSVEVFKSQTERDPKMSMLIMNLWIEHDEVMMTTEGGKGGLELCQVQGLSRLLPHSAGDARMRRTIFD